MSQDGRVLGVESDSAPHAAVLRVRLDISYDGTDFAGWAQQPNQRTVAGEVKRALECLFPNATGLTVAGRTDSGVHATGQVAHVDIPVEEWKRHGRRAVWRLRGILAPDVRITGVREVSPEFNARFAALWRRYVYRVTDSQWGVNPLRRHDTVAWPRPVDVDKMNAAAEKLLGEHDFAAFCKRREGATTVRALRRVEWRRGDNVLLATVEADAFCHSMVRSLVGAMLAVGEDRRDVSWLEGMLSRRERSGEIVVAPARGLTLVEVRYPQDDAELAARQQQTRRLRTLEAR